MDALSDPHVTSGYRKLVAGAQDSFLAHKLRSMFSRRIIWRKSGLDLSELVPR